MTDHDFVLTAVRQVNPRSAGGAGGEGEWSTSELLLQVEQRSGTMQTTKRETQTKLSPEPRRRRGLWVAVAALVVAVIAAGVVITVAGGDDEPDVAGSSVLASAESLHTAFNQGDFEAYRSLFAPGGAVFGDMVWDFMEEIELDPAQAAQSVTVSPASFGLQIEAECTESSPTLVRCTWVQRGGMIERSGIEVTSEVEVFFNQDGEIFNLFAPFDDQTQIRLVEEFYAAFGAWLREAHPDLFEATYTTSPDFPRPSPYDARPTLESRAQWAAVLDEFLTQSDVYPLGG